MNWTSYALTFYQNISYYDSCPFIIHLFCDDDAAYQDHPTGTFSVTLAGYELNYAYTAFCGASQEWSNVYLLYGRENPTDMSDGPFVGERYEAVAASASETYTPDREPIENISITFRTLSMRNGVPLIKTVVISGDRYYDAYDRQPPTVTYSETTLAISS